MLIEKINSPADLKKLSVKELNALAEELRGELIDVISKNGGHLSSNLGVVELTVSLHFLFDSPADRILWDVGHQSYVHKLLTGRRERFGTLRQFGGLSGFPNPAESAHDAFVAGHSGNSVSAALGFAEEEARRGSGRYTVAVVGDGSFTNGMIYEALNNCGNKNLRLIIVLNDNEMSISKNVGAVSSYFSRFRTGGRYLRFKRVTARALLALPLVGKPLFRLLRGIKNLFKRLLVSENLFELLGLEYIGPVDGNDLSRLNAVLREAKSMEKPCVVHVCTTKGKGYPGAERRPDTYHSVGAFDKSCGVDPDGCCTGFSALFGELMCAGRPGARGHHRRDVRRDGAVRLPKSLSRPLLRRRHRRRARAHLRGGPRRRRRAPRAGRLFLLLPALLRPDSARRGAARAARRAGRRPRRTRLRRRTDAPRRVRRLVPARRARDDRLLARDGVRAARIV